MCSFLQTMLESDIKEAKKQKKCTQKSVSVCVHACVCCSGNPALLLLLRQTEVEKMRQFVLIIVEISLVV